MSGLAACGTDHGSFNGCDLIPLKMYSQDFTNKFADQWKAVREGSELDTYIKDSMDLKDAVRACAKK
jgi:hypothetical protein